MISLIVLQFTEEKKITWIWFTSLHEVAHKPQEKHTANISNH
jgi:hypothetical protein